MSLNKHHGSQCGSIYATGVLAEDLRTAAVEVGGKHFGSTLSCCLDQHVGHVMAFLTGIEEIPSQVLPKESIE